MTSIQKQKIRKAYELLDRGAIVNYFDTNKYADSSKWLGNDAYFNEGGAKALLQDLASFTGYKWDADTVSGYQQAADYVARSLGSKYSSAYNNRYANTDQGIIEAVLRGLNAQGLEYANKVGTDDKNVMTQAIEELIRDFYTEAEDP